MKTLTNTVSIGTRESEDWGNVIRCKKTRMSLLNSSNFIEIEKNHWA